MKRCDAHFRLLHVCAIILLLALGLAPAQGQQIKLRAAQFDPLAGPVVLKGLPSEKLKGAKPAQAVLKSGELRLSIVQWPDGVDNEKLQAFRAAGGKLIRPIPVNAWLALAPPSMDLPTISQNKLFTSKMAPRWAGAMAPEWKVSPAINLETAIKTGVTTASLYMVQFALTGNEAGTRAALKALSSGASMYASSGNTETWVVRAQPSALESIAALNGVYWIEPKLQMKLLCERAGASIANIVNSAGSDVGVPGAYAAWLKKVGLSGEGVTVQIMDSGLDQGIDTNVAGTAHPDILGRITGIDNPSPDPLGNDTGGHGTLNASIIMGQPITAGGLKDPGGYLLGQGVAPNAHIFATKIFAHDGTNFDQVPGARTMNSVVDAAYLAGCRISSNSWGSIALTGGMYNTQDELFDQLTRDSCKLNGYQPMTFVFSAGNSGQSGMYTIGSPAEAKNVISVGAGENSDRGQMDGSMEGPNSADDIRDIAEFSSRGPTSDGRLVPTLFAPGTHVSGIASSDPGFTGEGVSGRLVVEQNETLDQKKYYPANQASNYRYTWSSGTSHSCPTVAGAVALLYEYCVKTFHANPSPALMKAMLVAGAVDTAGGNRNFLVANDSEKLMPIPNFDAGWGRCSISDIVEKPHATFMVDQSSLLRFNGQSYTYKINVASSSKPLKVVLSWTDPPGVPPVFVGANSPQLINDLDLTVTNGVDTWIGNAFANGHSVTGGSADRLNNLECVFVEKPIPAVYTVTVTAHNLTGDALPLEGEDIEQDFALYAISGANLSSAAQLSFDQSYYKKGESPTILLADLDLVGKGSTTINVAGLSSGDTEKVTLTESPAKSGFFKGHFTVATTGTPTPNNGVLTVSSYESIQATYNDNGGVVRKAQATVDARSAVLVSQQFTQIGVDRAQLHVTTSEPTQIRMVYGLYPSKLAQTVASTDFATAHDLLASPLTENTAFFYDLIITDRAGNVTTDNNGGAHYLFRSKLRHFDYTNDFESGQKNWTTYAYTGDNDWFLGTPYTDQTNNHAWFSHDSILKKDVSLVSPPILINPDAHMQFWQWYLFQPIGQHQEGFDGGLLEISTDNGVSWKDLGPVVEQLTPPISWRISGLYPWVATYESLLSTGFSNPLGGRKAWSGRSFDKYAGYVFAGMVPPRSDVIETSATTAEYKYLYPANFDLSSYANLTAQFRFRMGCDTQSNAGKNGKWIVDDFAVWTPADGVQNLARIAFDSPKFTGSQSLIRFTVSDSALSQVSGNTPTNFELATKDYDTIFFPFDPDGKHPLRMIDPSGVWEGYLSVEPGSKPNTVLVGRRFEIAAGEWVKLIYNDADIGDGSSYSVSDSTTLDWTLPTLLTNNISEVRTHDFTLALGASEPVIVTVKIGPSMSDLHQTYTTSKFDTNIVMQIANLLADRSYYYTVTIRDIAGNSQTYTNDGFGFGVRTKVGNAIDDTLEPSPIFKYTHVPDHGEDAWSIVTGKINHTPTHSWYGHCSTQRNDSSLVVAISEIKDGYNLKFWHSFQFDAGLDGGVIEISIDNGATWQDLGPQITAGTPYNYVIASQYGSALAGRFAWSGSPLSQMEQVTVNLSPYVGTNRLIRFRLVCDAFQRALTGWYIDDVTLDTYGPASLDFPKKPSLGAPADGVGGISYARDLTLQWAASQDAANYQVYVGTNSTTMTKIVTTVNTNAQISEPSIKPATKYYWRIVAINNSGQTPSDVRTFKTSIVDPTRFANYLVGKSPGLTALEKGKVDFDDNDSIDISDLIANIRGR